MTNAMETPGGSGARPPGQSPYNAGKHTGPVGSRPWMSEFRSGPLDRATINSATLTGRQLDDLLERPEKIVILESADLAGTMQQFETLARQTGKAVYLWRRGEGLASLKVADMQVPGSARLAEALRYVANSRHYGIYAFSDFESSLKMDELQLLRQIVNATAGYDRKVILLTSGMKIPRGLEELSARVRHEPQRRLRLRDGRWVV